MALSVEHATAEGWGLKPQRFFFLLGRNQGNCASFERIGKQTQKSVTKQLHLLARVKKPCLKFEYVLLRSF